MRIIVTKDYNDMSRKAANIISAQIITKPDCVLGLATGSSPVGAYKTLVDWYKKGDLDFSEVTTVNLDEYRKQLAEMDRQFGALLKQLPDKSEIEALLIEINQAGLGRGLQFELFKPGQEQVKDFYAELPITVKINGGYHDFGAFAADIAKLPRIVTLNNIAITPIKEGGQLSLDATTKTFRYLDDEEVARQKKAQQGAKK